MSLLLDALKQAERNKSQSPAETPAPAPAAPSDPVVRLDTFDFELGGERTDKVEPHVAPHASPQHSTIARAMEPPLRAAQSAPPQPAQLRGAPDPGLRAAEKRPAEQESERQQSAKQLFSVKQGARPRGSNATWIAGAAICVLALASGAVYFWSLKRGSEPIAYAPPPAPTKPVAAPAPQPSGPAAEPRQNVATEGSSAGAIAEPAVPAAPPAAQGNAPVTAEPVTTEHAENPAPPPQLAADTPAATSAVASEGATAPLTQSPAASEPVAAPTDTSNAVPAVPAATPALADEGEKSAASEVRNKATQSAAPAAAKRPARSTARKARAANDTWALQPDSPSARSGHRVSSAATGAPRLQRSVTQSEVHPELAAAYRALIAGDTRSAAQRYQIVLEGDSYNLDAHLGLATIAAGQGDRDSARRYYRRALELDPNNDVALAGLASIGAASGSSESALKTQLAQQPTSHHLHFALGNDLARQQRWPEAQQAYFNAYSLDPDNPDYAYNLAVSLDQLNQARAALSYYERAMQLNVARTAQFNSAQLTQRIGELKQTN